MENLKMKSSIQSKPKHKLSLLEKIAYGFGDLGNGFMFDLGQLFLLKFYTDVLGIPGAVAGGVFLVSKIFDAFADTTVGTIVDSRKNVGKRGKFRPFILFATVPLAITCVLSFIAPNISMTGRVIYAYATYMIFGLAYSFVNIPYGSLASSMTQDPVERTQLASFRQAGSSLGLLITGVVVIPLILMFPSAKIGYPIAIALMSIIGVLCHIFCYKNTKEYVVAKNKEEKKEKESIGKMFKALISNRPLLVLCLMCLLTIAAYNLKVAMMVYYCQYYLGNAKLTGTLNFVSIGCSLIGVAVTPLFVKKFGKKTTYLIGAVIWVIADLMNYFMPSSVTTFMIFASISYFGTAFINGLNWAFISDAIEYGEWKTGERTEGIIYSTYSFSRKLAQALAGFIPGIVLTFVGYVPNAVQSVATLSGIKMLMLLVPAVSIAISIFVFVFLYNLSDQKYNEILADLQTRNNR